MPTYDVCRSEQLVEGRGRPGRAGDRYIAVFRVADRLFALDNQCVHVGSPIDGGPVLDGKVLCPWHGWTYELETGDLVTALGNQPGLSSYRAWEEGGMVKVHIANG